MSRRLIVLWLVACSPEPRSTNANDAAPADITPKPNDPCAREQLGASYQGCEYYATVTLNDIGPTFHFAVVVSNLGMETAHVAIDGGDLATPRTIDVAGGGVEIVELPWIAMLEGCDSTDHPCGYPVAGSRDPTVRAALRRGGAYHIVSDRPITAYQFNPLEFQVGAETSHSNDASLLYPTNAMGMRFVVAAHDAWVNGPYVYPGFLSITATADATMVTVTTTAATPAGNGAPAFAPGIPQTIVLDRGDVLQIQNYDGDLTGSFVEANQPIQVIGGHYCTVLPVGSGFCDHLEENHPAIAALGRTYVASAPAFPPRTDTVSPERNIRYVRVIATEANTHVATDPPRPVPPVLGRGEALEIAHDDADLVIHADHAVLVAEYMVSATAPIPATMIGDPSMSIAVPVEQYRRDYRFHAPPTYERSYVNIVATAGSTVMLDGSVVGNFAPIGTSNFAVARILLAPTPGGDHVVAASDPCGISVYGYAFASSYWYPGGLDLEPVVF